MSELPLRESTMTPASPATEMEDGLCITAMSARARILLRCISSARELVGHAFAVNLPTIPNRVNCEGDRAALWLGPDEWLLLAPLGEEPRISAAFRSTLASPTYALIGVSHQHVPLLVCGRKAPHLLNAGCPLDLDLLAFPAGKCTRTVLAKAPILLWRQSCDSFYVGTLRSYVPYVRDFLAEASLRL